jgi:hypothetical protein
MSSITPKNIVHLDLDVLRNEYIQNDEETKFQYNPFNINKLQAYNPIYASLFDNDLISDDTAIYSKYSFLNMNTIIDYETKELKNANIFIKFSPLLDNLRYLMGKYEIDGEKSKVLPNYLNTSETITKLSHIHNSSYIDNFFCYLTSEALNNYGVLNGIDYYGSYLGIQDLYKSNVVDDIDYLNTSTYFNENKNEKYYISEKNNPYSNYGSRANKQKLIIEENNNQENIELIIDDIIEMDAYAPNKDDINTIESLEDELIYNKSDEEDILSLSDSTNTLNNSEINYSSDEEDDEDEDDEDEEDEHEDEKEDDEDDDKEDDDKEDEDDDEFIDQNTMDIENDENNSIYEEEKPYNLYIKDFPTQMIILEKCEGTLDSLFINGLINEEKGLAMLMQIIMTLLIYQKMFHFTHNDLHTNNIMYNSTKEEYVYYLFEGNVYKVPTYGYIYKIIDFGRSIYKYKGQVYCSDSFAPSGDAHGQYNFEPFMNNNKPRLEPNYSFDLCRLACSIYDFIFEDHTDYENNDELQEDGFILTIIRWIKDHYGKNILYKKNGEERYPNFKLYKMISRTVKEHTPYNQLSHKEFKQYLIESSENIPSEKIINIDQLPVMV